ncbi:carbohydrate kinase family protein [Streptomyces sp. NPDC059786]|uniref:carbohydrate kinase family protein n=1 Tax=Streptomyces sp. NPDC059786 TaxID=3346946 RepID=UPI0036674A14
MQREQRDEERLLDVVGLGALNVDWIAGATRLSNRMAEQVSESTARFEWNTEGPVDEVTITRVIERLGLSSLAASLGGSAWLTVFTLAQMQLGLRLGYVGALGRIEAAGLSFARQMDHLGIDRRWVARYPQRLCGVCLSYLDDVERVMLTHPGANLLMADHLRTNGRLIARYLARARLVHVTSFLDEVTPPLLLDLLRQARALNPDLLISFDPGYDWAAHRTRAIDGILAVSDLVFVNHREFKVLADYAPGESDDALSRRVLSQCAPDCTLFVTKRYDMVEVFHSGADGVLGRRFQLGGLLRETDLEDATGAGDVFSACVLAALVSRRLRVELGSFLGLSLARHRATHRHLASRVVPGVNPDGFLQSAETLTPATSSRPQRAVLLTHDENTQWEELHQFLKRDCRLTVHLLRTTAPGGIDPQSLRRQVVRCGFAVCVLSASRLMQGGQRRVNEDIVHRVGMFQGYYGFGRVAILAEDGCEFWSNNAGLVRMDFPPGHMDSVFVELERMLVREGLMGPGRDSER